jgi:hypothetical protein
VRRYEGLIENKHSSTLNLLLILLLLLLLLLRASV